MILTSKSQPELATKSDYDSPNAYMYLWQLLNLEALPPALQDPIKLGFAKYAYTRVVRGERLYFHGAQSRIIGNLGDIESCFNVPRGTLQGRIISLKVDKWDDVLASEQYVHTNASNYDQKVVNMVMRDYPTLQRAWCNSRNGGKTEWYAASEKTMIARFRNCWRKTNQEIGRAIMHGKRERGEHGVPVQGAPQGGAMVGAS